MTKLDSYINLIIKDFNQSDLELHTLKIEMKNHLLDKIEDLKKSGYSEEESIQVAIDEFGYFQDLKKDFSQVLKYKNNNIFVICLIYVLSTLIFILKYFVNSGFNKLEKHEFLILSLSMYFIYIIIHNFMVSKKSFSSHYKPIMIIFGIYLLYITSSFIFPLILRFDNVDSFKSIIVFTYPKLFYYIKYTLLYIPFGFLNLLFYDKLRNLQFALIPAFILILINLISNILKHFLLLTSYILLPLYLCIILGSLIGCFIFLKFNKTNK